MTKLATFVAEITRRGGETTIFTTPYGAGLEQYAMVKAPWSDYNGEVRFDHVFAHYVYAWNGGLRYHGPGGDINIDAAMDS